MKALSRRLINSLNFRNLRNQRLWDSFSLLSGSLCLLLIVGCSQVFQPTPIEEVPFRDRSETQTIGTVRVTAAVPSAAESRALFATNLYQKGIQPIWLQIENLGNEQLTFLQVGTDSGYFTPLDSAGLLTRKSSKTKSQQINNFFFDKSMNPYVEPGETRSGFLFSRLDEGTKSFNVDIIEGQRGLRQFTFFIPVPGLRIDHQNVDWESLYSADEVREYEPDELAEILSNTTPCCVLDKEGKDKGDPLNLVIVGDIDDVYYAFLRAGWDETETIYGASLLKTATSFFSGGEYRYSPVSGLYVFGRKQDVAFQKARSNIHERNHLRLWITPYLLDGESVWIGQISRDIGVRFTWRTITTHKIDPDVDETREFLLENLAYSQSLAKFAYVGGVGAAPIEAPRGNLTGDPYFTDGYRLVMWVSAKPIAMDDIEVLKWAPGE